MWLEIHNLSYVGMKPPVLISSEKCFQNLLVQRCAKESLGFKKRSELCSK